MSDKLFSIVILTWNRLDFTKKTIDNIILKTTVPNEIIIVDNGSITPGMFDYLENVKGNNKTIGVKLIKNERNYGIAWGKNIGMYHSKGDYIFLCDDDILVPDNYAQQLMEICDKIPKVGVAGICVEPAKYSVQTINGVRCRPKPIGNVGGATMCLPRRVQKTIGFLNGSIYGLEDSDLDVRIRLLGLIPIYAESYGKHMDDDSLKEYRKEKTKAHSKGSKPLRKFCKDKIYYQQTKNVYVPFDLTMLDREDPVGVSIFTNDLIKRG